ncbi:MAG: hypothetical protein JKY23_05150 [Nitrospinaceae bacterium]|nr:hypothetical protein [Nitrospinaceae bacterium]
MPIFKDSSTSLAIRSVFKTDSFTKLSVWSIVFSVIGAFVFSLIQYCFTDGSKLLDVFVNTMSNHYVLFMVVIAFFPVWRITVRLVWEKSLRWKITILRRYANMARVAGLCNLLEDMGSCSQSEVDRFKCDVQKSCKSRNEISIISATGFSTFGRPESLLQDTLESIRERINVFLLDPDITCDATRLRAVCRSDITREEVRKDIVESISYLKKIKDTKQIEVNVYLYKCYPSIGVISSGEYVWTQFYGKGEHVDKSPVYGFRAKEPKAEPQNLYCFFDGYVKGMRFSNSATPMPLNESVRLIDWDDFLYPGDINVDVDNIKPCRRTSGYACRRGYDASSAVRQFEGVRRLKDRRGLGKDVVELMGECLAWGT